MAPSSSRRRQPLLFASVGPWAARFGDGFFRALPAAPGVYFFRDASGQLLYIGQSNCLKRRIGSYRQVDPERHARRTLRLIRRTCQIEWQLCGDAAEAVALEAALLLEHRPPFNRAGVWAPPDCGLILRVSGGRLELRLTTAQELELEGPDRIGPLPARLRQAFAPLARCLFRAMHPAAGWWDYPAGLMGTKPLACVGWQLPPGFEPALAQFRTFLELGAPGFPWPPCESGSGTTESGGIPGAAGVPGFWEEQADFIAAFQKAVVRRRGSSQ